VSGLDLLLGENWKFGECVYVCLAGDLLGFEISIKRVLKTKSSTRP
jgi:hypothetical protein